MDAGTDTHGVPESDLLRTVPTDAEADGRATAGLLDGILECMDAGTDTEGEKAPFPGPPPGKPPDQ